MLARLSQRKATPAEYVQVFEGYRDKWLHVFKYHITSISNEEFADLIADWDFFILNMRAHLHGRSTLFPHQAYVGITVGFLNTAKGFFQVDNINDLPTSSNIGSTLKKICVERERPPDIAGVTFSIFRDDTPKRLAAVEALRAKRHAEENAQIEQQLIERLSNEAEDYVQKLLTQDPFYLTINTAIQELASESERLTKLGTIDNRAALLYNTVESIESARTDAITDHKNAYIKQARHAGNNPPSQDEQNIQKRCSQRIKEIITSSFMNNKELDTHRYWGTEVGRAALNIIMAVTIVPAFVKYSYTGTAFFSLETRCRQRVTHTCTTLFRL